MSAAEEFVDDFLVHHGIKGMKWGVRRREARSAGRKAGRATAKETYKSRTVPTKSKTVPVRTKVKPRKHMKTKIKTRGGRGHPATPEAISARQKQQILKKSGANALSNKDLQELQTRLNLEVNVSRLSKSKRRQAGQAFVQDQLKKSGKKAIKGAKVVGAAAVAA